MNATQFDSFSPNSRNCYFGHRYDPEKITKIGIAPGDETYKKMMEPVASKFKMELVELENEEDLEFWVRNESISNPVVAILFDNNTEVKLMMKLTKN